MRSLGAETKIDYWCFHNLVPKTLRLNPPCVEMKNKLGGGGCRNVANKRNYVVLKGWPFQIRYSTKLLIYTYEASSDSQVVVVSQVLRLLVRRVPLFVGNASESGVHRLQSTLKIY